MANNKILPHVAMSMYEDELDFILPVSSYNERVARRIAMEVDECYKQYEQEKAERIALETKLCWDAYNESRRILFEVDECYKQYACEESELIAFETEVSWLEYEMMMSREEYADDVPVDVYIDMFIELKDEALAESVQKPSKPQRTGVYRCKQEVRHKNKLHRNAINAMNNLRKRNCEDLNNMTFSNRLFVINKMDEEGKPLRKYAYKITYCKRRGGHPVQLPKSLTIKAEKVWARAAKMDLV